MKIFKKDGQPQPTKLQKRISGLQTHDLVSWVETTLYGIGKAVAGLGAKSVEDYAVAEENAEALLALIQELKRRAQ